MENQKNIIEVTEQNKKNWNATVDHPLQSWEWGEFRKAMGIDVVRLGVFSPQTQGQKASEQRLEQGLQLTFHSLPHLPFTVGYFPKGPAPTTQIITAVKKLGKEKKSIFIQLEPNILHAYNLQPITYNLSPSHHPLFTKYTFVLNLTKSEDELLKEMHSKTRYNIRIAEKYQVIVREDSSLPAFEAYLRLTKETTERQRFYAHTSRYHSTMWKILSPTGIAKLFTATYQNNILAAWIIFCWNDTIYYPYGSSSRDNREVMAPTLLLWEIAKWGKRNGYKKFDLWGAMGPNPDTSDPWYGFHRFKEGFHPVLLEFAGSFDLITNQLLYPVYCVADDLRWKYLRNRR